MQSSRTLYSRSVASSREFRRRSGDCVGTRRTTQEKKKEDSVSGVGSMMERTIKLVIDGGPLPRRVEHGIRMWGTDVRRRNLSRIVGVRNVLLFGRVSWISRIHCPFSRLLAPLSLRLNQWSPPSRHSDDSSSLDVGISCVSCFLIRTLIDELGETKAVRERSSERTKRSSDLLEVSGDRTSEIERVSE